MSLPDMPKLSERLKYLRVQHGFSQTDLALKAGTTQQAIQQAEKGQARQPRYLPQLARALDIPVEWMMFGKLEGIISANQPRKNVMNEKSTEVLESFYAMPKKDQDLIYELMQSRKKK